jgi:hypothetical protein
MSVTLSDTVDTRTIHEADKAGPLCKKPMIAKGAKDGTPGHTHCQQAPAMHVAC